MKELKIKKMGEIDSFWCVVNPKTDNVYSPYLELAPQTSLWVLFTTLFYGRKMECMGPDKESELLKWLKN